MTSKRAAAHAINFILEIADVWSHRLPLVRLGLRRRSDSDEEHRTVHGDGDGDNHGVETVESPCGRGERRARTWTLVSSYY